MRAIKLTMLFIVGILLSKAQNCNAPVINSFTPNTGFIGSTVTIFGANFDANPSNNQVFFGATEAEVVTASFGQLTVTVPVGATLAPISIRNNCDKIAYSRVPFNGIFCPTPITAQTYNSTDFSMSAKGAYNMIAMDMDLDGKPDVLSGGVSAGGITIAHNQSTPGNLNFTRFDINTYGPQGHAVADFDGDGKMDIVMSRSGVYVHRNLSTPGNLAFGPMQVIHNGLGAYQITIGDINNDGKIDIITEGGNYVRVFLNTSTGNGNISFAGVQNFYVGQRCTGLQAADVDSDGRTDVLGTQGNANRAVTLRNTTVPGSMTVSFEGAEYWPSNGAYPYRCMIADFDKDGKIDLTTCNYNGATNTAIFRNISTVGDIQFAPTVNLPSPQNNYRIGVGDANGDGYPDIVTKSLGINVFSVYENTSTAPGAISFAPRFDYNSSAQAEVSGIVIADLDGDFVPDIATSGISSNQIRFHRNNSSQVDNVAPTANCKNITVALNPNGEVDITAAMVDNGSSDACGLDNIAVSQTHFTCADIGDNEVTLTVTDNAGNTATCTAIVNVAPAAVIVAGQTTVCQGQTIAMSANLGDSYQWKKDGVDIQGATSQNYIATESGAYSVEVINAGGCSGVSAAVTAVVNDNPTVDVFPAGGNAYLCGANGTATISASQSAIYQWQKDGVNIAGATQQELIVNQTGTYTVEVIDLFGCSAVSSAINVSQNNAEFNLAEGTTTINQGDNSDFGTVYPNNNYTKTFTVSNTGSDDLIVSAINVTGANATEFTVSASLPLTIAAGGSATYDVVFNGASIDTYSASVALVTNDCDETNYAYNLSAEITCVAASFTGCPSNISVGTDANSCDAVVNYEVTSVGNPAVSYTYAFSGTIKDSGNGTGSGSTFPVGTTNVTLTVSNACGTDVCQFTVTVTDNEAPTVLTQDVQIALDANGTALVSVADIDNGSFDNCGISSISINQTDFNCAHLGTNTVMLTVLDNYGNANNATATVTVVDEIAPTITCGGNISEVAAPGDCTPQIFWDEPTVADNCSTTVTASHQSGDEFPVGTTTVTYTVVDPAGNDATCSFDVTVSATPLVLTLNSETYNGFNISCNGGSNGNIDATISGGCEPYAFAWSNKETTEDLVSISAGTYTVVVTDANGSTISETITLTEPTALEVNAGSNQTVYFGYDDFACASIDASANGGVAAYSYSWSNGETTEDIQVCPETSTDYTLTVTDANGCVASDVVTVCSIDVHCRKGGKSIIIGEGDKVVICHAPGGNWNKAKTLCIGKEAVADHLAHGCKLGECGVDASCDGSKVAATSTYTHTVMDELMVQVMPNPFSNTAYINLESANTANFNVSVYSMTGQLIEVLFNGELTSGDAKQCQFDANNLANGIYFVRIVADNGETKIEKVVLNR